MEKGGDNQARKGVRKWANGWKGAGHSQVGVGGTGITNMQTKGKEIGPFKATGGSLGWCWEVTSGWARQEGTNRGHFLSLEGQLGLTHYPDDEGNMHLWNVGLLPRDYTLLHPRKLLSSLTTMKTWNLTTFYLISLFCNTTEIYSLRYQKYFK
jgi:hypothetical protein